MLLRFAVKNFLSFKDRTEFNMLTGDVRRHKNHVQKIGNIEILKAAAIYGANGSGKSNVFKVMDYMSALVKKGVDLSKTIETHFLLDKKSIETEQEFEVEFVKQNRFFVYKLIVLGDNVLEESLCETFPNTQKDEIVILKRDSRANTLILKDDYLKSEKDKIKLEVIKEEILDVHKTALKILCDRGYTDIDIVYGWFSSLIFVTPGSQAKSIVMFINENDELKNFLIENLRVSDIGITDFQYEEISLDNFYGENESEKVNNIRLKLSEGDKMVPIDRKGERGIVIRSNGKDIVKLLRIEHSGKTNCGFPLWQESLGTRRFLDLLPAFFFLLHLDVTVFIDEIESSIHPLYIKELLKKTFGNPDIKGQMIFTSHESNLLDLDIFRQDEIWFTKKDNEGCTHIYSLSDFKPRYDFDIKNGYLTGRFGGIPFLGKLEDLDWNTIKPN